jgi:hypothetical protein
MEQPKKPQALRIVPVIHAILKLSLSMKAFAVRRMRRLPFGSSLLVLARKRLLSALTLNARILNRIDPEILAPLSIFKNHCMQLSVTGQWSPEQLQALALPRQAGPGMRSQPTNRPSSWATAA